MNKTKQEKWQRAYGDTPDSFRQRVAASLPKGEESRHVAFPRRAMVLAAALVLVLTTAYAAVVTQTELVWNAGHPIENEADDRLGLLTGKAGTSGDSLTIGGVTAVGARYTLDGAFGVNADKSSTLADMLETMGGFAAHRLGAGVQPVVHRVTLALLPLREKVARAAGRMRGFWPSDEDCLIAAVARPLIRRPAAATFSRKGRRILVRYRLWLLERLLPQGEKDFGAASAAWPQ